MIHTDKIKIKGGFTLIEMLIYIAIVSVVLSTASSFVWNVIYSSSKSNSYKEVQQNIRFANERIIRSIRNGESADTLFSVSGGILEYSGEQITTNEVVVENLNFTEVGDCFNFSLGIKRKNPQDRNEYRARFNTTSSVCERP